VGEKAVDMDAVVAYAEGLLVISIDVVDAICVEVGGAICVEADRSRSSRQQ
jgi:hypothetical protein